MVKNWFRIKAINVIGSMICNFEVRLFELFEIYLKLQTFYLD